VKCLHAELYSRAMHNVVCDVEYTLAKSAHRAAAPTSPPCGCAIPNGRTKPTHQQICQAGSHCCTSLGCTRCCQYKRQCTNSLKQSWSSHDHTMAISLVAADAAPTTTAKLASTHVSSCPLVTTYACSTCIQWGECRHSHTMLQLPCCYR
jgi:hypothetical protein